MPRKFCPRDSPVAQWLAALKVSLIKPLRAAGTRWIELVS
jgi:hypothetical protein